MNRIQRKFAAGGILIGGVLCLAAASAVIRAFGKDDAVPVSVDYEKEPPIIVLDAGQEAYVVSIVV
ncbi:MAG: hypothetical protein PUA81_00370 [Oscillospiraceae bacterium]|nr:hypothetical protein [Oscillospiraceae bacterium]